MNLETEINKTRICLTDKVLYFPCISTRPKIEYPDYSIVEYKAGKVLFIPCADRSYKEIAENLYEGIVGLKVNLFNLSNKNRKVLYDFLKERNYIYYQKIGNKDY